MSSNAQIRCDDDTWRTSLNSNLLGNWHSSWYMASRNCSQCKEQQPKYESLAFWS